MKELAAVAKLLGWPEEMRRIIQLPERIGPGNVLMLEAEFDNITEMTSGFGKLGVPAESVGEHAAKRMAGFLASTAAVRPYLADQLLLPLALAGGGSFTTVKPTEHGRTAAAVIAKFLPIRITYDQRETGDHLVKLVTIGGKS